MQRWIEVARADELQPGEGKTVVAAGERIALFNDCGDFLALDDGCPHQGASLGEGLLHEGRVICPWHSWVFDLRSGRCPNETHEGVRSIPTRCRNGAVQVKLGTD